MELNSAGNNKIGLSSNDIEIEKVKQQIQNKCSKLQTKLNKVNTKLKTITSDDKNNQKVNLPSSSGTSSTATEYVASNEDYSNERIKIKEKIKGLKNKFARVNLKINGGPEDDNGNKDRIEIRRIRASSEHSPAQNEKSEFAEDEISRTRSTINLASGKVRDDHIKNRSTTSLASGEVRGDHIKTRSTVSLASVDVGDDYKNDDDSKKSKKRRRRRYGKTLNDERIMEEFYDLNMDKEFKLNSETLLILDLLSMSDDKRQEFLLCRAKALSILIENKETHNFDINPKISKLRSILNNGKTVWEINNDVKQKIHSIANQRIQKIDQPKREKPRPTFEELVNAVVFEGLSDEQKKQFTLSPTSKKPKSKNYFCTSSFNKNLEEYAQKCVNANLGVIIEGEIRVNAKNNDQAFIKHVYGEKDAMFTSLLIRKCSLHGDIVRAFIRIKSNDANKETTGSATDAKVTLDSVVDDVDDDEPLEIAPERSAKGFVIKIIKENPNRRCVGNFLSYRLDSEYITFVPRDMKMPNIRIYRENWPGTFTKGNMENIPDVLYVAEITEWSGDICLGKIIQPVGKCGELVAENSAILLENRLLVQPYETKFNEMFYGPLIITNEDIEKRQDLRSECIFTIDPLTAVDLDDSLSCKRLSNGNYEIGVHISDVSHFLKEDSELDCIVQQRTTSVYMVNEVYHMLPKSLCLKCSLLAGEQRLAFSVLWEITPDGDILTTKFFKSIIKSCTQLAYEHAQKVIDFPDKDFTENDFPRIYNGFTVTDIVEKIKVLHSIALKLRKIRFGNGALRINRPKLYFDLDPDTGAPANYGLCQLNTANFLIEEYMLLANQFVAKFIFDKFPDIAILRNHEPPLPNVIKDLKDRLKELGLELDISSSKTLYDSILRLVSESKNPDVMEVCLSNVISKPMTRAKYFCSESISSNEDLWHYALSIPIYTHFTSPIRRYPDVLVHRILSAALDYAPPPKRTPKELADIAATCNEHKFNAKVASEDSSNLYFLHYIKSKQTVTAKAAILNMWLHAMEVILVETGHIVRVPYPKEGKKHVKFTLNSKTKPYTAQLVFTSEKDSKLQELKMFSEIFIELYVEKNKLRGRIPIPQTASSENNGKDRSSISESSKGFSKRTNSCGDPNPQTQNASENIEVCESNENKEKKTDNDESSPNIINMIEDNLRKFQQTAKSSVASNNKSEIPDKSELEDKSLSLEILTDLIFQSTTLAAVNYKESSKLSEHSELPPLESSEGNKQLPEENTLKNVDSSQSSQSTAEQSDVVSKPDSSQNANLDSQLTLNTSEELWITPPTSPVI